MLMRGFAVSHETDGMSYIKARPQFSGFDIYKGPETEFILLLSLFFVVYILGTLFLPISPNHSLHV